MFDGFEWWRRRDGRLVNSLLLCGVRMLYGSSWSCGVPPLDRFGGHRHNRNHHQSNGYLPPLGLIVVRHWRRSCCDAVLASFFDGVLWTCGRRLHFGIVVAWLGIGRLSLLLLWVLFWKEEEGDFWWMISYCYCLPNCPARIF